MISEGLAPAVAPPVAQELQGAKRAVNEGAVVLEGGDVLAFVPRYFVI